MYYYVHLDSIDWVTPNKLFLSAHRTTILIAN